MPKRRSEEFQENGGMKIHRIEEQMESNRENTPPDKPVSFPGLIINDNEPSLMKGLKGTLKNLIDKLVSIWRLSYFGKFFPSLMARNPDAVEKVRSNLLKPLESALCEDVSNMIEDQLSLPLQTLSSLIKNNPAKKKKKSWRPTGNVMKDMVSPDVEILLLHKRRLLNSLEDQRQKTLQRLSEIKIGKKKIKENSAEIQNQLKTLKEIHRSTKGIPVMQLQEQVINLNLNKVSPDV